MTPDKIAEIKSLPLFIVQDMLEAVPFTQWDEITEDELFDAWLNYIGIIGYTPMIKAVHDTLFKD